MTGAILTAIVLPLIGAAVQRLVGPGPRFLLGLGASGFMLYVAMLLHIPPMPVAIGLVAAAVLILLFVRGVRPTPPARTGEVARAPQSVAATVVTAAPIVLLLFASAVLPLRDYDGRAFWVLKAKAIAHEKAVDGPFFRGERGHSPKNEYPLLVPVVAGMVMMATGDSDDLQIRWIYVLALGSFAFHARRWTGSWPAALIAWLPQFAIAPEGGALSAYSDIIMAAFVACALFELMARQSALRFGLWISFLVLTKNEGLPFALVLLVAGIVLFGRRIGAALPPLAAALAALFLWKVNVRPTDDDPLFSLLPTFPEKLDRVLPAARGFLGHAIGEEWGFFWIAVLAATIFLIVRRQWRDVVLPAGVIVAMTGVYVVAYTVTIWPLQAHIAASADRLLMHFVGPAVVIIGALGRNRYSRDPRRLTEASPEGDLPHPDPFRL